MTATCCPIPRTIAALIPGNENSWAHNSRIGPFMAAPTAGCEISNRWCFIVRDYNNFTRLLAWVSDDQGASWYIKDINGFEELTNSIVSFDAHQNPTDLNFIHVATQETTTGRVSYHKFSLSLKLWISVNNEINSANLSGGPPLEETTDEEVTLSGTPTDKTDGTYGKYVECNNIADYMTIPNAASTFLNTTKVTIFLMRRKQDLTLRENETFGLQDDAANTNRRCTAHLPWTDGNVYWDFGGNSGNNRLSYAYTTTTNVEAWVFRAGPTGKKIFLNGTAVASDANVPTRTNAAVNMFLNKGGSVNGDLQDFFFFAVVPDEVSNAVCATFTVASYATNRSAFVDALSAAGYPISQAVLFNDYGLVTDAYGYKNGIVSITADRDTLRPIIAYDSTPELITDFQDRFLVRKQNSDNTWSDAYIFGRTGQADTSILSRIVAGLNNRIHAFSKSHAALAIQRFDVQTLKSNGTISAISVFSGTGLSGADLLYIGSYDTYLVGSVLKISLPLRIGGQLYINILTDSDTMTASDNETAGALIWYGSNSSLKPSSILKYTDQLHSISFKYSIIAEQWIIYDSGTTKLGPEMPLSTPREFDGTLLRIADINWLATLLATNSGIKFEFASEEDLPTADILFADWLTENLATQDPTIEEDCSSESDECGLFELYKILLPTVVQVLPIAKRYDQIGSTELFRYGKVRKFFIRLIAFGGTSIPYEVFFEDDSKYTGTLVVLDGKEDTYEIGVPMGTSGHVLRIELGPTDFDFHRFYFVLQVMKSGKDTENEFIQIE